MSAAAAIVIGLGQLGSVFAQGLLRNGHTVVPILRGTSPKDVAEQHPAPALVLVAVAEDDLDPLLASLPEQWRDRVGLVQNELLPPSWQKHGIQRPSVAVVWFEKKAGKSVRELLPTVVHGPQAALLAGALARVSIGARVVDTDAELLQALVEKNLYIWTTNIAGLEVGGSVGELWQTHRDLAEAVASDVIELQQALAAAELSRAELFTALERAILADPAHQSTGRSAPARLARALRAADRLGLDVPTLRRIAAAHP